MRVTTKEKRTSVRERLLALLGQEEKVYTKRKQKAKKDMWMKHVMATLAQTIILVDITTYVFIRFVCKSATWSSVS